MLPLRDSATATPGVRSDSGFRRRSHPGTGVRSGHREGRLRESVASIQSKKIGKDACSGCARAFRVELRTPEVALANDRRQVASVLGRGHGDVRDRCGVTVYEIDV